MGQEICLCRNPRGNIVMELKLRVQEISNQSMSQEVPF